MIFNQKNIYKYYGQYDQIVTVRLRINTDEFNKYGKSLTGSIRYTKEERKLLQKSLTEAIDLNNFSKIKIDDSISELSHQNKYDLFYEGLNISSIEYIFSIPFNNENLYTYKDVRKIPEPVLINFDSSNFNEAEAYIWLNNRRRKNGKLLTTFEEKQDIAYRIIENDYNIPKDLDIYKNDSDVLFYILKYKFLHSIITEKEYAEFDKLLEIRKEESVKVLMKVIEKETANDLSYLTSRKNIFQDLNTLVVDFEPERLCSTKIPIWWNLERCLHIFMGHISELIPYNNIETNTPFQYNFKDIKTLIINILESLIEEINLHFKEYPNKDFKRQGGMSYYYKGDYYAIHIRKDGLLQTIYKNN